MANFSDIPTADALLAHERLVRAVATDLLRDEHAAQDVVQDTWLRALRSGPRALAALPRWLARVAANRSRDLRRAAARRRHHEERAWPGAVGEPVDPGEPVEVTAERLAVQRDVVAAILALHEPYRTVVLLRYHHDLTPTAIATRLQQKPATVRTQLTRAHELLRERLDRQHGDRRTWVGVLAPSCAVRSPATFLVAAGLLAAGVALVSLAASWQRREGHTAAVAVVAAAASDVRGPAAERPAGGDAGEAAGRAAVPLASVRVLTAAGAPAAGRSAWFWPQDRPAWTRPATASRDDPDFAQRAHAELGTVRPAELGPAAATTDGEGLLTLPAPRPRALTIRAAESVWLTVDLSGDPEPVERAIVLPALATLRGRVERLPPGASWDIEFGNVPTPNWCGDFRIEQPAAAGGGVVFQALTVRRGLHGEEFVTDLLAAHPVRVCITGHGAQILPHEADHQGRTLPADVTWSAAGPLPTHVVRVFERDGTLTKRPCSIDIGGDGAQADGMLTNGMFLVDTADFGPAPSVLVCLANGDSLRRAFDFHGAGLQRACDIVLADLTPPLRVHLPELAERRIADVVVQHNGNGYMQHGVGFVSGRPMAAVGDGFVWLREHGARWPDHDHHRPWERLAVVADSGEVALVERSAGDPDDLFATWRPSAAPRDLAVAELIERAGAGWPASVGLEFLLPTVPSRRVTWGDGTESRWIGVRFQYWNDPEPLRVWKGLRLASEFTWRLRVVDRQGGELAAIPLTP